MEPSEKTTITVSQAARERLSDFEHSSHDNIDDTVRDLLNIVPSPQEVADGCLTCSESPGMDGSVGDLGGVLEWFTDDYTEKITSNYFCGKSCFADHVEELNEQVPKFPDKVIVGGDQEVRFEIEDHARFQIDAEAKSVEFEVPVDICKYDGEPIYVVNAGKVRFRGVVDSPMTVDGRAYATIEHDREKAEEFHPDDA